MPAWVSSARRARNRPRAGRASRAVRVRSFWAGLYGYFLFDHLPDRWTVIGAAGIVGAGLYIFRRERQAKEN